MPGRRVVRNEAIRIIHRSFWVAYGLVISGLAPAASVHELAFPEAAPNAYVGSLADEANFGSWAPALNPSPPATVWPWPREIRRNRVETPPDSNHESPATFPWLRLYASMGVFPAGKLYPFGQPFESFQGDWGSYRLMPEQGVAYTTVPPAFSLALAYPFSPHLTVFARASLKRDIRAWHDDPMGKNWPTSADEVDMNEPTLGYLFAHADWGHLILGRFPVHMGPSPEFSLLIGGQKPAYDAALFSLKASHFRYHFLISSLNTWLEGTPSGDTASTDYPIGSEAWRQSHYLQHQAENAHLRVYDERVKTLTIHRMEARWGMAAEGASSTARGLGLVMGLSEMQILGGKIPDGLDIQPFTVWHNDFKSGYSNNLVHADARMDLPSRTALFGELAMDDLPYAPKEGKQQKAILGWLIGLEQTGRGLGMHDPGNSGDAWTLRLHLVHTDPRLYHFVQPYNTLYARQVLSSNVQPKNDPGFIDRFVIDYPVGYVRGGDAFDLWVSGALNLARRPWLPFGGRLHSRLAYLQHGETSEATLLSEMNPDWETPSGTPLEEWRGEFTAEVGLLRQVTANFGAGMHLSERGHETSQQGWASLGLVWRGVGQ